MKIFYLEQSIVLTKCSRVNMAIRGGINGKSLIDKGRDDKPKYRS